MARFKKRVKRPSRFEKPTQLQGEPKYEVGERVRNVIVDVYRGHGPIVPGDGKKLTCDHHWYECLCDCGKRVIRTQQQLNDTRRSACGCNPEEQ